MHITSRHVLRLLAVMIAAALGGSVLAGLPAQAADTTSVTGRITYPGGAPVANASVFVTKPSQGGMGVTTDADGVYDTKGTIDLTAGTYTVSAYPTDDSYDAQSYRVTERSITLTAGQRRTDVDLVLKKAPSFVFTVRGPDGKPLTGFPLQVLAQQGDGSWAGVQYGPIETDATGRWRLGDLGGTKFKVRFATERYTKVPHLLSTWYGGTSEATASVIDLSDANTRLSAEVTLRRATITRRAVKISGTTRVGRTLSARTSAWSPKPVTLTHTWYRNGKRISGQTKKTYKLRNADLGKRITVRVTGTKSGYATTSLLSAKTAKIKKKK